MIETVSDTIQVHIAKYIEEYDSYKFLVMQRSLSERVYPGFWQVITGIVEQGETAMETALREVREETGFTSHIKIWTIPYVTQYFTPETNKVHLVPVFGMLVDENAEVQLSDEHIKFDWLQLDSAINRLMIPSHCEATRIFNDFILSTNFGDNFK